MAPMETAEVEWQRMPAHEIRVLAQKDAVVILPLASIEQHGPHLPTMTDTRLGHEVAMRAARIVQPKQPVVVTPVVWSGLSEHHMPFGGTLTVSAATFRAVVSDLITSLTRLGFRKILLSNSHGGNIMAMQQLCDELSPECPATLVATTYAIEGAAQIGVLLEDQDGVQHAGEAETSMMLACEAGLVDTGDLAAIGTPGDGGPGFLKAGRASYRWRPFAHTTSDGVSGTPEKSTAQKGDALLDASAEAVAALILDPDTWAAPKDMRGAGTKGVPFAT